MESNDKTPEKFTCVFALRGGYRRISQRIYQRHGKIVADIARAIYRVRLIAVWLFLFLHYFSLKRFWPLTYSIATVFAFEMFRLMLLVHCRTAISNKKELEK